MENELSEPVLKMPDLNARSFWANGTEYFIHESISIKRFAVKQKFDIAFAYGSNFKQVYDAVKAAYQKLNERKDADAAVELYRLMEGLVNVDENQIGVINQCTLFINSAGENIAQYEQHVMDKKIRDWSEEGIDIKFFFLLAARHIPGFIDACKERIQSSLKASIL